MARKQQGKTNSCRCNIARGTTIVGRSIQFCTVGGYRDRTHGVRAVRALATSTARNPVENKRGPISNSTELPRT